MDPLHDKWVRFTISLHAPSQGFVEPVAELQIVAGVNDAVAISVEVRLVSDRFVESAAKDQIVAGVDDGFEIDTGRDLTAS